MKQLIPVLILLTVSLSTCVDPYFLELEDYESLMVVEGMITDELASYTVKLSKTFQDENTSPDVLEHAEVSVSDENGVTHIFQEEEAGVYKSDSSQFRARIGGTYTLHIRTEEGLEYISTPCTMTAVPRIDSIYYEVDSEVYEAGTVEEPGIRIYLDAENREEASEFLRWEFEEVWEFRVPYPIFSRDLGYKQYVTLPAENDICWKYERSKQILIHSSEEQSNEQVNRKPIHFIASAQSNRLLRQYSIQLSQYSISREEYTFWEKLKEITESETDIFDRQPFPIEGNISCINKDDEQVLGLFQVSAVKKKRIYITKSQARELEIPLYEYSCERLIYPNRVLHETFYEYLLSNGYVLFYVKESDWGPPENFQFTTPECADCSLSGNPEKPSFWVEMD